MITRALLKRRREHPALANAADFRGPYFLAKISDGKRLSA